MTTPRAVLSLTFNHVAFPPQLPGRQDPRGDEVNADLTRRLLDATRTLRDSENADAVTTWNTIEKSLTICTMLSQNGHISKSCLRRACEDLTTDHVIILNVAEQNAGVMIRLSE